MVNQATGETHVMHRVEMWRLEKPRPVLAVVDGLMAAQAWCTDEVKRQAEERASISESVDVRGRSAYSRPPMAGDGDTA